MKYFRGTGFQHAFGEDCFAIGYGVEQESVSWMVSSHFRGSNELCDAIEQSAIDFRAAFADED